MVKKKETKHERFLRLAHRRVERAAHELRLVSQLSSENYENTPDEAEDLVSVLDEHVRHIAGLFGVEYASRVGKVAAKSVNGAGPLQRSFKRTSVIDEIEAVKIMEDIRAGRLEEALNRLRTAVVSSGNMSAGPAANQAA